MDDKKYASFTDDFRARIERERAQGGSGDARERGDFKGKDEDQSKIKSEDAASVASSDSSQDGGEVMGTLQKSVYNIFCLVYKVSKRLPQESQQVSSKARSQESGSRQSCEFFLKSLLQVMLSPVQLSEVAQAWADRLLAEVSIQPIRGPHSHN